MEEELFTVERILAKRFQNNREEFLVKWEGYSSAENSWEPRQSLAACTHLIDEFSKDEEVRRGAGQSHFKLLRSRAGSCMQVLNLRERTQCSI